MAPGWQPDEEKEGETLIYETAFHFYNEAVVSRTG
jgi:hypothetical protein